MWCLSLLVVPITFFQAPAAPSAQPAVAKSVPTKTLSFVNDGVYKGCFDTELWELSPNKVMEAFDTVTSDANNDGGESQILMRFEEIIGKRPNQIPPGSRIKNATLIVIAFDPGNTVDMHRMLVPWPRAATWNNMVSGVSADGLEASRHKESFTFGKISANKQAVRFEATDSVQAWVNGRPNYGWVFLNTGANGWDFYSSEYVEKESRPMLVVEFVPPSVQGNVRVAK